MAETPITSLTTSTQIKKGVNPLFSCENERFVSLALLAGSGEIVGKNKKSRGHDLYTQKNRGPGAIFTYSNYIPGYSGI